MTRPTLWKHWLLRFVVTVVFIYGVALIAMLAFGRKQGAYNPLLAHSLILALIPVAIIGAFALPGRKKRPLSLVFLTLPLLQMATC
ncbi:hypothetical protein JK202_15190 [Gluconobacter sp. Dm-62]|uniref:hypothetical protein n=1 Tax=Gluconobacter sp. Dm-62 TaxID=2799804 RepID=UPI001B8B9CCD|nr:hypothetical protein [Gluconobacter sp. Dm-62]MBS1104331.1 hypothetical protein [Gluconobacter sp. Dm-62]